MNSNNQKTYRHRDPTKTDLHKIIRENYQQVFYDSEIKGTTFPFHLRREFSSYLNCGVLYKGFARFHCGHCQKDKLVAYSCKRRAVCPSCSGRRMADTAKHLVDHVIPDVPVRQWVLSLPYAHRFLLSSHPKLLTSTIGIFNRAISSFYKQKAKSLGIKNPQVGSLVVIQRFGGALNLNMHFHSLFMDGVFYENESQKQVFKVIVPSDEDVRCLVNKIKIRINRSLQKKGFLDTLLIEETPLESALDESPQLTLIKSESIQNRVDMFQKPRAIGKLWNPPFEEFSGSKCAASDGFSLHANVKIRKGKRASLERLCRYIARGPVAKERVSLTESGHVRLQLKKAYTDGTTHFEFTPEQFLKRLIALIPPPRQNFIRYFGVFGARHKNRRAITALARPKQEKQKKKIQYRTPWAELLKRVFQYEVNYCDHCGTKLTLVACITSQLVCAKILKHLKMETVEYEAKTPRAPPVMDGFESDDLEYFDQAQAW